MHIYVNFNSSREHKIKVTFRTVTEKTFPALRENYDTRDHVYLSLTNKNQRSPVYLAHAKGPIMQTR